MTDKKKPDSDFWVLDRLVESLHERAKELNCIYRVSELLSEPDLPLAQVCPLLVDVIPSGWQHTTVCQAKISVEGSTYMSPGFVETPWVLTADIMVQDTAIGSITVSYMEEVSDAGQGVFLRDETRLINTIADRLGYFICHQKMRQITVEWESVKEKGKPDGSNDWRVIVKLLQETDRDLYLAIARKMLNHLCWSGIAEAETLLQSFSSDKSYDLEEAPENWNQPHQRKPLMMSAAFCSAAFKIAANYLDGHEILKLVQKWIQEDKLGFLVQVVNRNLTLAEVADAIRRYEHLTRDEPVMTSPSMRGIQVSLIRRFLSDQQQYINVAKNFVEVPDFCSLINNMIFTSESHGRLGGKSAGFFLAQSILTKKTKENKLLANVKIPKTWFITSDVLIHFMHYNNMEDVVEQKYKDISQVRREYPHIIQTFKSAHFPTDIVKGLSMALDDLRERPLIVRSSSLLEDRFGAAFSGRYKSLFLANRGTKHQRLEALMDAISEVYASTFGPDPIEYRSEKELIDFAEEMGIIIQEVVGSHIGKYFLPSYAGVGVSNNEFRWSPRIKRKDGLIRIVPGLGTRAVDRLSNDYPVLIAPGQPGLRANVTADEILRYAPSYIDVINLETRNFETIELAKFLKEVDYQLPAIHNILSINRDGHLVKPGLTADYSEGEPIATFDGLVERTSFVPKLRAILQTLEQTLNTPVDIEFASDGESFYLLQCRAQCYAPEDAPAQIPKDIPTDQVIFTANRFVSNGRVPEVTHIVYIDPQGYGEIPERAQMVAVGRAVSRLNKLLPKRKFILMGPGRWGSRGDIKLGVPITYSDINNTAVLIEMAMRKGHYVPDLSFGTHFFQDLVEANIRYLPLFPDDEGVCFNEDLLMLSENSLPILLPEFAPLAHVIKLINVPEVTGGNVCKILMNAEQREAVAYMAPPDEGFGDPDEELELATPRREEFWRWRTMMAEQMASSLDGKYYGVTDLYLFGSTKNASAGPGSDIDILVHFTGTLEQRKALESWFDGWSLCLDEMNHGRTGYRRGGLLDVYFVSDENIAQQTGYAVKIGAISDPARPLQMKRT